MSKVHSTLINKFNIQDKPSVQLKKESIQDDAENKSNMLITPPYDTSGLAKLYDMNAYHQRCCLVKAGVTTRLGYTIYDPKDAKKATDEDYEKADQFIVSNLEEIYNFQLDFEIFGNGYGEIVRNRKNEVSEFHQIGAKDSNINIINKIRFLQEDIAGTQITYVPYMGANYKPDPKERREYIHMKNYNPNSRYYGIPEYIGVLQTIYLDDAAKIFNINRFSNPIPETIISMFGFDRDAKTEADVNAFFSGNFGNPGQTGKKALVLWSDSPSDNSIKIDKMDADIKDAAFRGMRQDNREEIVSAHGLSPRLVGLESISRLGGGGEVREQLKLINELVFMPRKKTLARFINSLLLGMNIMSWKIKFDSFEFTNALEDATWYQAMIGAGIISPEYAAGEIGYPLEAVPGYGKDNVPVNKSDGIAMLAKQLRMIRTTLEDMKADDK